MPTTKSKSKKDKGMTLSVSPAKRAKKAPGRKQVPINTVQDLDLTTEEEDVAIGQDGVSQKLETMMRMVADLSSRVHVH